MLIIDPEKYGARLYTDKYVGFIHGTPYEVCNELSHRIFAVKEGLRFQSIIPKVVVTGCGYIYVDCLKRLGAKVEEITSKHYQLFLPQTC